jgi:hypothetical protein
MYNRSSAKINFKERSTDGFSNYFLLHNAMLLSREGFGLDMIGFSCVIFGEGLRSIFLLSWWTLSAETNEGERAFSIHDGWKKWRKSYTRPRTCHPTNKMLTSFPLDCPMGDLLLPI